jgi:adenosine deaminase
VSLEGFIRSMPKVELHVHLIGAIGPERLLALVRRNAVPLPVSTVEEIRDWFRFRDFAHFIEIYVAAARCIQSEEDLEDVARDFLAGQAAQNIRYMPARPSDPPVSGGLCARSGRIVSAMAFAAWKIDFWSPS